MTSLFRRIARHPWIQLNVAGKLAPHMSVAEQSCYESLLTRAKRVVEYGVGGTTLLALEQPNIENLISVDSDPRWIAKIHKVPEVASAISSGTAQICYINIGEVSDWGWPVDRTKIDQWPKYAAAPWDHVDNADLVLVDGRFRVACILESLLRAKPSTLIAVHDFWNRPNYHVVLPFMEWRETCQTLGIFNARRGIDKKNAFALLEKARTDCS